MVEQTFQSRHHVPVADVPGFRAASEHRAVVGFSVADDPRVLFGDEVLVGGDASVALRVFCRPPSQIDELLHDFVFARAFDVQTGGVAVPLHVLAEGIEAGVALTSPLRRMRIDLVEVLDDTCDRTMEAVQIQAVESRARIRTAFRILGTQPAKEPHDLTVPPHPPRKSSEISERVLSGAVGPDSRTHWLAR